jgi:hypothetical protein
MFSNISLLSGLGGFDFAEQHKALGSQFLQPRDRVNPHDLATVGQSAFVVIIELRNINPISQRVVACIQLFRSYAAV